MNKKGFISISVVYSFLIVFILLMLTILSVYTTRDNMIDKIVEEVKAELE